VWLEKTVSIFGETITWKFGAQQIAALGIIWFLAALNFLRVSIGGRVQAFLTLGKVLGIGVIVVGVFFFAPGASWENFRAPADAPAWSGFKAFGAAMLAALWAYEGWSAMPMIAGEVKNPQSNIPRALILGMAVILTVYGLTNLAYFHAMPFEEIATSSSTLHSAAPSVAAKAASSFWPGFGAQLISLAALVSIVGVLNGVLLTSSRIPYAMARDGLWFRSFGALHATSAVPIGSICLMAVWASVLALSATFDQLTDSVVFASMMFYAATTAGVFVLRKKMPDAPRPYKTFGYPVVPLLFILVAVWLLLNTVMHSPLRSALGLSLIALGFPVYLAIRRRRVSE
jgi:basic amino acid/polyamine antiporter, APA family